MYRHSTCAHNDTTYTYTYWSWKLINLTCSALGQRCSYFWAITFGGRMWLLSLFHRPHRDGHMIWAIMHVSENRAYSQSIPTLPFSYSFMEKLWGKFMKMTEHYGTIMENKWENHASRPVRRAPGLLALEPLPPLRLGRFWICWDGWSKQE